MHRLEREPILHTKTSCLHTKTARSSSAAPAPRRADAQRSIGQAMVVICLPQNSAYSPQAPARLPISRAARKAAASRQRGQSSAGSVQEGQVLG